MFKILKMNSLLCLCFALFGVSNVICASFDAQQAAELCLKRYKSGNEFDMKNALGEWYPIYFWPANAEKMEKCATSSFALAAASDIKDCKIALPQNETIYEIKYSSEKLQVVRYLYGPGDAMTIVDCKADIAPQSKVVHSDLGNGKLLAALCPSGSAVLLSKNLISAAELEPTVEGVEVMKGIHGAPDCKLPQ